MHEWIWAKPSSSCPGMRRGRELPGQIPQALWYRGDDELIGYTEPSSPGLFQAVMICRGLQTNSTMSHEE